MKKFTSLLTVILTLAILVCGCQNKATFDENISCEDVLNAAISATDAPQFEHKYLKSENNMDTVSMSLWSDGLYAESDYFGLLGDYAIYVAAGTSTYEVAVLKPKSSQDIEKLVSVIETRKLTLAQGDKGMYDPDFKVKMDNSVLKTDGDFVIFVVTDNNDAALQAIDKLKSK